MGDGLGLSAKLAARLVDQGFHVRRVVHAPSGTNPPIGCMAADFTNDAAVKQLHAALTGREGILVSGLINLFDLTPGDLNASSGRVVAGPLAQPTGHATALFRFVREMLPDLVTASEEGGGWVMNVTSLDGAFGTRGDVSLAHHYPSAASIGLFKSLLREQGELSVKNIDAAPECFHDLDGLADRLVTEFRADENELEVGLGPASRCRLIVEEVPVASRAIVPGRLSAESVVLVTGGAYGVTADVAIGLARRSRGRLILVGRSPLPEAETSAMAQLDPAGLRKHWIQSARESGERLTPAEIERRVQRQLRDRQMLGTLAEIRAAGAEVEYHAVDVRDAAAFGALLDALYARHGRLDGVVHGAGVIEDKRIGDKTPDAFDRVFGTKVDGALVLAAKLRPESLRFLVLFSSVSGRLGNMGQSDYAAANEVLNKFAAAIGGGRWFDGQSWSGRVVSINWGPWDAGMISGELRQLYLSKGIGLIPLAGGVAACLEEIERDGPAEVILASWPASMFEALQGGFLKA